ncbi:unnamed protein product, partial [Ectocarpus fasciculatus]
AAKDQGRGRPVLDGARCDRKGTHRPSSREIWLVGTGVLPRSRGRVDAHRQQAGPHLGPSGRPSLRRKGVRRAGGVVGRRCRRRRSAGRRRPASDGRETDTHARGERSRGGGRRGSAT